jgi:hypothetical protein
MEGSFLVNISLVKIADKNLRSSLVTGIYNSDKVRKGKVMGHGASSLAVELV